MKRRHLFTSLAALLVAAACDQRQPSAPSSTAAPPFAQSAAQDQEDPLVAPIRAVNHQLAARGLNVAIPEVEFYTLGPGPPTIRILQRHLRRGTGDPPPV